VSSSPSEPLGPGSRPSSAGPDREPAPGERTATHELWGLLRRPFNVVEAVDSVLGLSPNVVKQLTGAMLATCREAEDLLAATPKTIRSLSISMSNQAEECRGELRGPVLWSETFSCRSSSAGRNDVYVCAAPSRAYDIPENRVLVAALLSVRDAGWSVDSISARSYDDDTLRKARYNGQRASRLLEHRALSSVARHRPSPREIRRARSGNRRSTYTPALTMLARAVDPLEADDILPFCDRRTRAQHAVLVSMVRALGRRGLTVEPFRAVAGTLQSGLLRYHHPRRRGDRSRPSGILVGPVLVDVPERVRDRNRERAEHALSARSGGRPVVLAMDLSDVERAIDLALSAPGGSAAAG
jgi:hypothetical protein